MVRAFIGIGSNLGRKEKNIRRALSLLGGACKILKISSLYKTEPLYYKKQPWFLNCVAEIETGLPPKSLLQSLQQIESISGRIKKVKYGPRIIDLDILFYGKKKINSKHLRVPHPRLHERRFVLIPLVEIAPNLIHPISKTRIRETLKKLKRKDSVKFYKKFG